jgi:hypothetical protein
MDSLSEMDRNVGPMTKATGVEVVCSPGKEYIWPESTTAQNIAYGETTVDIYLFILII